MTMLMETRPMVKGKGRPKKPGGEGTQVRIDSKLAAKAKYVATAKDVPLVDYLSGILRTTVERDFQKAAPSDKEVE